MSSYTITTLGLSPKDVSVIKSLIRLFKQRFSDEWELLYYQTADIVIYDPSREQSQELLALSKTNSMHLCYTSESRDNVKCLSKPVRASQFIDYLNQFAVQTQTKIERASMTAGSGIFDPDLYWLGSALSAITEKRSVRIQLRNLPALFIDGAANQYYSELSLRDLKPFHQAALQELEITWLSADSLQTQANGFGLQSQPLSTLLWAATLSLSKDGAIIKDHSVDYIAHLTHWPDFSTLPHKSEHMNIALKMVDGKRTLHQIAAETKITLPQIVAFYNACAIIGLVKQQSPKSAVPAADTARSVALFGFSDAERKALTTIFLLSKARKQQYKIIQPTNDQSAPILLIASDNPEAMQTLVTHMQQTGNSDAFVIPVCNQRQVDEKFCIVRPLTSNSVCSVLDQTSADNLASQKENEKVRTALVVDDSLAVRIQLEQALQQYDFSVMTASTGEQALELADSNTYDLIFLDVVMPGIDGYEVCRQIKKNPKKKNIPVVMLTSKSSSFDKIKGKLSGCNTYLTKPVDKKIFQQTLAQYIQLPVIV